MKQLSAHHWDDWEVLPVVLEATADEEGPEKGPSKDLLESLESSNVSLYWGVTVVGGIRLISPLPPLSPTGCRQIFQMDALGSTTTAPLLGGGHQSSFSHFRAKGPSG